MKNIDETAFWFIVSDLNSDKFSFKNFGFGVS